MADIRRRQQQLLDEGFLDDLGSSGTTDLSGFPLVQQLLIEAAAVFIEQARENINTPDSRGRVLNSTGALSDGLVNTPILVDGTSLTFSLGYRKDSPAASYFDYVNQGVKGIKEQTKAPGSPYSFKANKGLSPGRAMRQALEAWIANNRQVITAAKPVDFGRARGGPSGGSRAGAQALQTKRKTLTDIEQRRGIAYAIGTNIRKKGLQRTAFFDKALESTFNQSFYDALASVVGAQVSVGLRRLNSLSNE